MTASLFAVLPHATIPGTGGVPLGAALPGSALTTNDRLNPGTSLEEDGRFPTTFTKMVKAAGYTLPRLAHAIGVEPLLLENIAAKRQALPIDVARLISNTLVGAVDTIGQPLTFDVGMVMGLAGVTTMRSGPAFRVPYPRDPLVGDDVHIQPAGRLANMRTGNAAPSGMMVVGNGILAGHDAIAIVDQVRGMHAGLDLTALDDAGFSAQADFTVGPGGLLYLLTPTSLIRVSYDTSAVAFTYVDETTDGANILNGKAIAYEPTTNTIWATNDSVEGGVYVMTSPLPNYQATHLPLLSPGLRARYIVAANGKLYVTGGNGVLSLLLEVDPSSQAVTRTMATDNPTGVATDYMGNLLLADATLQALFLIDVTHSGGFDPLQVSGLPADMLSIDRLSCERGTWSVSCRDGGGLPRLVRFQLTAGAVASNVADYTFGATAAGIPLFVAEDSSGQVWVANPNEGTINAINATLTTGDPSIYTANVGGNPARLAFL